MSVIVTYKVENLSCQQNACSDTVEVTTNDAPGRLDLVSVTG
jgi:hypothetical protein